MDFEQVKKEADKEIGSIYNEYLHKGYKTDFDKTLNSDNSFYFTKLVSVDTDENKARFARVCITENPAFTEKNFLEEQKYACKHPTTPYIISTATIAEELDIDNINKLSSIEKTLLEKYIDIQLKIPNFEKGE